MIKICDQRRKVLDATGHCLVLGGPGSGKTTLALLKAQAHLKQLAAPLSPGQQILFLSFSRAAVARIADAVKDEVRIEPAESFSIQTFHSFFWRILQGYAYLINATRRLSILFAHDEKAMSEGIDRTSPLWRDWETRRMELFRTEGRVCFDLFAPLAAEIFKSSTSITNRIASRYPLILVDEAQDTGKEQWECIRLLSARSQIICLADPDQMIYDYIPGVEKGRLGQVRESLKPLEINFQNENNRSGTTQIAEFARDILDAKAIKASYVGLSRIPFPPSSAQRDKAIRQSIGRIKAKIQGQIGRQPASIALFASYTRGVSLISSALQKDVPIRHEVLFDEAFGLLSSRIVAFLLEPKFAERQSEDVAVLLELVGEAFRSKGNKTAISISRQCTKYASRCRAGDQPKVALANCAATLVTNVRNAKPKGKPNADWGAIKGLIQSAGGQAFKAVSDSLGFVVGFGRGKMIYDNLSSLWIEFGDYRGARQAVEDALRQDSIIYRADDMEGIHVMNMHKCKGKQFEGVILFRQKHHSPFVWRGEPRPHESSRRLLHMSITRARYHVLILDEASSECPILGPRVRK